MKNILIHTKKFSLLLLLFNFLLFVQCKDDDDNGNIISIVGFKNAASTNLSALA